MWTIHNRIHLMSEDGSSIIKDAYFSGGKYYEEIAWEDFKKNLNGLIQS